MNNNFEVGIAINVSDGRCSKSTVVRARSGSRRGESNLAQDNSLVIDDPQVTGSSTGVCAPRAEDDFGLTVVAEVDDDRFGGALSSEVQAGPTVFLLLIHPKDTHLALESRVEELPFLVAIEIGGDDVGSIVLDRGVASEPRAWSQTRTTVRGWNSGPIDPLALVHQTIALSADNEWALVEHVVDVASSATIVHVSNNEDLGNTILVAIGERDGACGEVGPVVLRIR